jgi:hypothetical protein
MDYSKRLMNILGIIDTVKNVHKNCVKRMTINCVVSIAINTGDILTTDLYYTTSFHPTLASPGIFGYFWQLAANRKTEKDRKGHFKKLAAASVIISPFLNFANLYSHINQQ